MMETILIVVAMGALWAARTWRRRRARSVRANQIYQRLIEWNYQNEN